MTDDICTVRAGNEHDAIYLPAAVASLSLLRDRRIGCRCFTLVMLGNAGWRFKLIIINSSRLGCFIGTE